METVPFLPFRWPNCGSFKPLTYSVNRSPNMPTMRYHTCQNCRVKYRSVQIERKDLHKWLPDDQRKKLL